ncbi:MAG: hypothetical protein EOO54_19170 [Haliea sp.]|nr:MAG: hypothetical protein EOO54_19170 [Haliea sp.]
MDRNGSYGTTSFVPKGATSVVLDKLTVPPFVAQQGQLPNRNIIFSYRMMDTSNKTAVYRYN